MGNLILNIPLEESQGSAHAGAVMSHEIGIAAVHSHGPLLF